MTKALTTKKKIQAPGQKKSGGRLFKKGQARHPKAGRKKGTPNAFSRDIQESVLAIANEIGSKDGLNGYFRQLYRKYPKLFASFVLRIVPLQHQITQDLKVVQFSREQIAAELQMRGIDPKAITLAPSEYRSDRKTEVNGHGH